MTLIKNIGEVTALVAEASTANEPSELLDGKSGDTAFPYAKFKALATVGEVDPVTKMALTGYPDGNAAWLKDNDTVRVAYQSESYATMSNETYGWLMESGVKFTGSHIHTIDYDRAKFASFLDNEAPASTMFKASGHLFDKVYNVFGKEVTKKTTDKLDLAGKWGNQTNPDGTIVEFLAARQLTEGDFFFHSFCGAWYEPANKYGADIGFSDDIWLMGEEWNIGSSMFADPDGSGPLKGFDVANSTMGLASMVVDIKNEVAYTAPALGQAGYEKLMPINSGHEDYVVIVAAGYNHDINPAPLKVYVGRKGLDAAGNQINFDNPSLSERDRFLGSNGLLYGQLYGMAANAATYAQLGITSVNADSKMLDAYLQNAAAPDDFSVRFYATDYRWNGFDTPEAVKDTEILRWAQDGDTVSEVTEANKQPAGDYTFFNSDTKVEHPASDPNGGFRYIQNHTATGAILGVEFTNMVLDLTRDLDGNKLPDYLSADVTRILPAVNGALTLDVGGKGEGHYNATGNPNGATAEKHIEGNTNKSVAPDGLLWVKSSDADVLIVDEDSGNDYGERKFALVINEDTLAIEPDGTGYFLAQAGGSKNPRALAGVSAYGGTYEAARGAEFSGSWDVTALVATKADGSFYTQQELAGNGVQIVEQSRPLSEHVFIGVVQQPGESGGAVEATKADYGGQIFMFSIDLPGIEPAPVVGTSGADSLLMPDASKDLTLIGNTIFTGAGDDEVDVALSDGFENKVFTGSGADTIFAGTRDNITGGGGADQIWATGGNGNRLSGNGGDDDFVIGTMGNRALGGEGNDKFTILDGAGTNYLNGGAGSDQFWLISAPGDKPAAKQFVMDFKAGEDLVGLRGVAFADLSFTQVGTDTLLSVTGTAVGHFTNVSAASLNNQASFAGLA
jgi:Ca2+-binding RTX toxin-like protein